LADGYYRARAKDDFSRARTREVLTEILSFLTQEDTELLPLDDVRKILKPRAEVYRGMKTVPLKLIVGSEGRYRDFNKNFLPRKGSLRHRWESIDQAHHQSVILPPIMLYEIGGVYFVRDGNHRVSVARTQGVEFIDAEVTALGSDIPLSRRATRRDIKRALINFEKEQFYKETGIDRLRKDCCIEFTETGRYDDIREHIEVHKYYVNLHRQGEISYQEGMLSWCDHVYRPIVEIIRKERILSRFPGRTESDLYVWIVRRWDELKKRYGQGISMQSAAEDFSAKHGRGLLRIAWDVLKAFFRRIFRSR